ncbi:MAG: hypothetical protein H0X33_07310 [Taibaiella sp.]|nr:hypothetical protein [Taibaiella sp.]
MKKLTFAIALMLITLGANAQNCTITNNTGCTVQYCLFAAATGSCTPTYTTCGPLGPLTVGAFSSVTLTPAYFSVATINWLHFDFMQNIGSCTGAPPTVNVGDICGGDPATNSATVGCGPCAGTTINLTWAKTGAGVVTITLN